MFVMEIYFKIVTTIISSVLAFIKCLHLGTKDFSTQYPSLNSQTLIIHCSVGKKTNMKQEKGKEDLDN